MLIQVLDDSDDALTRALIQEEVSKWRNEGADIVYRHRELRQGYKAGNLKSAMKCSYVKDYEFVAIFDADFQPSPDFLKKTVPYFKVRRFYSSPTKTPWLLPLCSKWETAHGSCCKKAKLGLYGREWWVRRTMRRWGWCRRDGRSSTKMRTC